MVQHRRRVLAVLDVIFGTAAIRNCPSCTALLKKSLNICGIDLKCELSCNICCPAGDECLFVGPKLKSW